MEEEYKVYNAETHHRRPCQHHPHIKELIIVKLIASFELHYALNGYVCKVKQKTKFTYHYYLPSRLERSLYQLTLSTQRHSRRRHRRPSLVLFPERTDKQCSLLFKQHKHHQNTMLCCFIVEVCYVVRIVSIQLFKSNFIVLIKYAWFDSCLTQQQSIVLGFFYSNPIYPSARRRF